MPSPLKILMSEIRQCTECADDLPYGPRPVLAAGAQASMLIIGQAPGIRVHKSGVPWDDPSGERLRDWMGMTFDTFYDSTKVAIVPMGFCYPGTGKSGDLPPRKECAKLWHGQLLPLLTEVKLTLLIGQYAQRYVLADRRKSNLTETVKAWREFTPEYLPLPHPSPRNNIWLKKNDWFTGDVLPYLKRRVCKAVSE